MSLPTPTKPPAAVRENGQSLSGPGRLLLGVFALLDRAAMPYCVLHGYEGYPATLGSDVDCVMPTEVLSRRLGLLLHDNRKTLGADLIRYDTMVTLTGDRAEGRPYFLDLHATATYEIGLQTFYAGREILESRRRQRQFWVPAARIEFGCSLVRRVAKEHLGEEHARKLTTLYREDPAGCREQIARFWGGVNIARLVAAADSGNWELIRADLSQLRRELFRRVTFRHPLRSAWNCLTAAARRVRRLVRPGGLSIIVLGPDGVGKSSVIGAIRQRWAGAFPRATSREFPPALFRRLLHRPIGEPVLPHALPPRSYAASVVRAVLYWWLYYTLGYYLGEGLSLARRTLVLHDRHVVDAIVDPKRYRYGGPSWLLCLMWRLIPKPDLVVLLDAPAEVVQKRKQEVAPEVTAAQRQAYRRLLHAMPNGAIVDATQPLEDVVADVNGLIRKHLAARAVRRIGGTKQ
jgi:thymidylate kinase